MSQVHELRGLPLWLLKDYLCEIGGQQTGADRVTGPGWQARLAQLDDFQVGSIRVGQVRLELEVEEVAWEAFSAALEKKLLRAGG
ncbi:MAG: DUF1952 domain-containing protein [Chloroflexota bacterium]